MLFFERSPKQTPTCIRFFVFSGETVFEQGGTHVIFRARSKPEYYTLIVFSGETVFERGGNACYFSSEVQTRVLYLHCFQR